MWTDVDGGKYILYICPFRVDETSTIEKFLTFCTIIADGELLKNLLTCNRTDAGKLYYELGFTAVLSFGLTELAAHIRYTVDVSFWSVMACMISDLECLQGTEVKYVYLVFFLI